MDLNKHKFIFNFIAPVYNWFFNSQRSNYSKVLTRYLYKLNIPEKGRILDAGCGTGTLTHSLVDLGYEVTGIDMAEMMMKYGEKRGLDCRYGNITKGLDFKDKSFDLVTSAYVVHGLDKEKRKKLFLETSRLSRGKVLFHDYSTERNIIINIIEYLEDGDYFNFIKDGLNEMKEIFSSVEVIKIKKYNNWYICTP